MSKNAMVLNCNTKIISLSEENEHNLLFLKHRVEIRVKIVIEDNPQFQGHLWLIITSQF